MGCWNHTCAVTNLPIHWQEEVEVILLRSSSFGRGNTSYCRPDSVWSPIPLTFSGTYNDYGSVENCHGPAFDIIIDAIRENLAEREEFQDENDYTQKAITKEGFDVVEMFDLDHDGILHIKNPIPNYNGPEVCRIKHIVVRKDVYDGIVTKTKYGRWWNDEDDVTISNINMAEFTKDLDVALDPNDTTGLDKFSDFGGSMDAKEAAAIRRTLKRYQMYEGNFSESPVIELISHKEMLGVNRPVHPVEIITALREEKSDLYGGVLDNALRFGFFNVFMDTARKTYTVPSGAGSQDDTTRSQELCARLTLSSAKAQRKWQKDRYEE